MNHICQELKNRALQLCTRHNLLNEMVSVTARTLTPEEAIGNPEGDDFPLQKGRERLMQAEFRGAFGQAFCGIEKKTFGSLLAAAANRTAVGGSWFATYFLFRGVQR